MSLESISCNECMAELVLSKSTPGISIRCSGCGHVIQGDGSALVEKDSGAWWSLWLGLSSIVLFFITGLPALYLGLRSLLKMRFVACRVSDRRAAIAGTVLGTVFGVILGLIVAGIGFVAIATVLTLVRETDPVEIQKIQDEFATVEIPNTIMPIRASVILLSETLIDYRDNGDKKASTCIVQLGYLKPRLKTNFGQLKSSMLDRDFGNNLDRTDKKTVNLKWKFCGEDTNIQMDEVVEEVSVTSDTGETTTQQKFVHRYFGIVSKETGVYALLVLVRQPNTVLNEDDVKKIFESYTPVPSE